MEGGGPGAFGRNTWVKLPREEDGVPSPSDSTDPLEPRQINIGGKATIWMGKGDRLLIETPGGGAWGERDDCEGPGVGEDVGDLKVGERWEPRGSLAERATAQASV
jgi:5-oxoprolinase (ATP-hydrolysing)